MKIKSHKNICTPWQLKITFNYQLSQTLSSKSIFHSVGTVSSVVPFTVVLNCSGTAISRNSSSVGIITFISLLLLEMMLTPRLSWLRNIWHPSVFSTLIVGAEPSTWWQWLVCMRLRYLRQSPGPGQIDNWPAPLQPPPSQTLDQSSYTGPALCYCTCLQSE